MKKCPYCNHDNADDATNCQHCFAGLPEDDVKTESDESEETTPRATRKKRS